MPDAKTCTLPDCDRPHRALGLCGSHYNQQHVAQRHIKYARECSACGVAFKSSRATGIYCSLFCRDYVRFGPRAVQLPKPRPAPQVKVKAAKPSLIRDCAWCGFSFETRTSRQVMCSRRCKAKSCHARRRARIVGAGGTYTWSEVIGLHLAFGRRCAYCDQIVDGQPDPDHVVPLSRGGHNSLTNILPCCRSCNSDKRDLLLHEWAADRERLGKPAVRTSWSVEDPRFWHLTTASLTLQDA